MTAGAGFRGQPLLMLICLLLGWLVLRTVVWPRSFVQLPDMAAASMPVQEVARLDTSGGTIADIVIAQAAVHQVHISAARFSKVDVGTAALQIVSLPPHYQERTASISERPHQEAALPRLSMDVIAEQVRLAAAPIPYRPSRSRWSGDGWVLLRRDSARAVTGAIAPGYGQSQMGGVLRYDLSPESGLRPQAFIRASSALSGRADPELAAGLSARAAAQLPLRFAVEARASDIGIRPAFYAVTELPVIDLPLGARAEVYAQAGYVGGRFATGFADGQARIERELIRTGPATAGVGAGMWGGVQEGAARLDIGPTAALRFPIGKAFGRLAADYRFRIAGDAAPDSGPALTLSAGF